MKGRTFKVRNIEWREVIRETVITATFEGANISTQVVISRFDGKWRSTFIEGAWDTASEAVEETADALYEEEQGLSTYCYSGDDGAWSDGTVRASVGYVRL